MSVTFFYLAALCVGVVAGVYLPLNGRFGEQIGSPLLATAIFFTVGAIVAGSAWSLLGNGDPLARMARADLPLFGLGAVSFGIILCATVLIPKVGPGAYFVCLVAGQVVAGLVLSHFGWLSPERLPLTPLKILGAVMILGGVGLVRLSEERARSAVPDAPVEQAERGTTDRGA